MTDRKRVDEDAETTTHQIAEHNGPIGDSSLTQVCADAETAQPTSCTPKYDFSGPVPEAVEDRAIAAGIKAVADFRAEWRAEMRAHEFERQEAASDTGRPVLWLAEDPCPSWCVGGLDHDNSAHPDDRAHFSSSEAVALVTMESVVISYPSQFAARELMVSLDQRYREREARVCLQIDDRTSLMATLGEAEQLAHTILKLVAAGRGQVKKPCLDEACPDVACHFCYPAPAPAVAST